MEEEKAGSATDAIEVLNQQADETQLRSMTIAISERKSSFTVACSKWNENFRRYMMTSDFENELENLQMIMDGSI